MLSSNQINRLRELAQQASEREGCRLYDLSFGGHGSQRTLRVFIDKETEPVSVENCADVSKGLSLLLDVDDPIPGGRYELEVSSPGLERPLKETWHYQKVVGSMIHLKLRELLTTESPKRMLRTFKAKLVNVDEQNITVDIEGEVVIPRDNIDLARSIFSEDKNQKGQKRKF